VIPYSISGLGAGSMKDDVGYSAGWTLRASLANGVVRATKCDGYNVSGNGRMFNKSTSILERSGSRPLVIWYSVLLLCSRERVPSLVIISSVVDSLCSLLAHRAVQFPSDSLQWPDGRDSIQMSLVRQHSVSRQSMWKNIAKAMCITWDSCSSLGLAHLSRQRWSIDWKPSNWRRMRSTSESNTVPRIAAMPHSLSARVPRR